MDKKWHVVEVTQHSDHLLAAPSRYLTHVTSFRNVMGVLQPYSRDSNRLRQRPNSVEDVGFKNATFNEIDHSVVYQPDHHHRSGGGAAAEEGVGERCINETSLITGAVIFLIAQVRARARVQLMVLLTTNYYKYMLYFCNSVPHCMQGFLLLLWTCLWKRRRSAMAKEVVGYVPEIGSSSTDSLSYIYDAGIPKRMN